VSATPEIRFLRLGEVAPQAIIAHMPDPRTT